MAIIEAVQQYDLTDIPAGGSVNIDVQGDRLQFISAMDPFAVIEVKPNYSQGNITLRPGQGFRFSQPVNRWVVINRGLVPLKGFLLIGSGDFFDQRISGTVDVIDGGKARTLGGLAMMGYANKAAVAANFSRCQIWNPAGTGRRVCIEAMAPATGGVGFTAYLSLNAVPLATLQQNGQSKLAGGAASVCEMRTDAAATLPPVAGALLALSMSASKTEQFTFTEPLVLLPGSGMLVWATVPNGDLGLSAEWYEELI